MSTNRRSRRTKQRGTAYVELLVMVGVILTLGLAAMTTIGKARDDHSRKQADCIKSGSCGGGTSAGSGGGGASGGGSGVTGGTFGANGGGGAAAKTESDDEIFHRLLGKVQRGERLTAEDKAQLDALSAKSDKGLVTVAAGVAVSGKTGSGASAKLSGELNSDKGLTGGVKLAQEQKGSGNVKAEGSYEDTTSGEKVAGSAEYGIKPKQLKQGPVDLGPNGAVGAEFDPSGRMNGAYAKGSLDAKVKLPGGGEVKAEAYVKATLNNLTPEQQRAVGARMAGRAAEMGAARADNMALLEYNRQRVANGESPVDRLP